MEETKMQSATELVRTESEQVALRQIHDTKDTPHDIEFSNVLNKEKNFATCNLLRVGEIKILLDCGCDERITDSSAQGDMRSLRRVEEVTRDVHYIFLSHATVQQVGALPYLHKLGRLDRLQGGILSTSPVAKIAA